MKILVKLEKISDVYEFVSLTQRFSGKVIAQTTDGKYTVDGASLLGLFSIDLLKSFFLICEEQTDIFDKFKVEK